MFSLLESNATCSTPAHVHVLRYRLHNLLVVVVVVVVVDVVGLKMEMEIQLHIHIFLKQREWVRQHTNSFRNKPECFKEDGCQQGCGKTIGGGGVWPRLDLLPCALGVPKQPWLPDIAQRQFLLPSEQI